MATALCQDTEQINIYTGLIRAEENCISDLTSLWLNNEEGKCLKDEGDTALNCQCSEEENSQQVETRSSIIFKLQNGDELNSGFALLTTNNGHYIQNQSGIEQTLDIKLKDGDILKAINRKLSINWNHWILLESLKYLLYTTENKINASLIVERVGKKDSVNAYEISIFLDTTELTTRGDDKVSVLLEIKSFIKRITYVPRMRCVKFQNLFKCKISQDIDGSHRYLKIEDSGKLIMAKITDETDHWDFDCYEFNGLQMRSAPIPSSLFICVLRSCHDFCGHRPYVMAKTCETVGTMVYQTMELDVKRSNYPDPRFFTLHKTANGCIQFQSLIYKEFYLACKGDKVRLKKVDPSDERTFFDMLRLDVLK